MIVSPKVNKYLLLAFWSLAIIIPTAGVGRFFPAFRRLFDFIFAPHWVHVLMHVLLFAALVVIFDRVLSLPVAWQMIAVSLGVVLGIGLLQEGFQALESGYFSPPGALVDLGVDLCGGIIGLVIVYGLAARKSSAYWASW
jgi:hypothetical protein